MLELVKSYSNDKNTQTPVNATTGGNLSSLTHEELLFIANCNDREELREKMAKHASLLDQIAKQRTKHSTFLNQRYSQAISSALTDAPSFPVVILWTIMTSLASIGILTLTLLTASMTLLAGVLAGFYIWSIYKDLGEEKKTKRDELECLTLRLAALTELNERDHQLNGTPLVPAPQPTPAKLTWRAKLPPRLVRRMIDTGMVVSATLLCTYYVAINSILAILGMTIAASAMATPIGIAIAVVIALAIGGFFAFKQYQLFQRETKLEEAKKSLEAEGDHHETQYTNAMRKRHNERAFVRGEHHDSDQNDEYARWLAARGTRDDLHLNRSRLHDFGGQSLFTSRRPRENARERYGAMGIGTVSNNFQSYKQL